MRRRATATTTTATAAAVGRKFKIEYLASNFHRSSKNRAVSYLAGGQTPGCSPPRSPPPPPPIPLPPTATRKDGGKRNAESSPLHTVTIVLRDRLCSDMETHGNAVHACDTHVCTREYVCDAAHRWREASTGRENSTLPRVHRDILALFQIANRPRGITDVGGLCE